MIRPLVDAPFGRTALSWYSNGTDRRNTGPTREYTVHIGNIELTVDSLAWQQQDGAVASCATVAIWTMLQSAPYYRRYSAYIADVTRAAMSNTTLGERIFPAKGLQDFQIRDAISALGLGPVSYESDDLSGKSFTYGTFNRLIKCFLSSGYPILLSVLSDGEGHSVCVTGFKIPEENNTVKYIYINDDNLGPNVRFQIVSLKDEEELTADTLITLELSPPAKGGTWIGELPIGFLEPQDISIALHEDVRLDPTILLAGAAAEEEHWKRFNYFQENNILVEVESKIWNLTEYFKSLEKIFEEDKEKLADVINFLLTKSAPFSLNLGVWRLTVSHFVEGQFQKISLADILIDTSEAFLESAVRTCLIYSTDMNAAIWNRIDEKYPEATIWPASDRICDF